MLKTRNELLYVSVQNLFEFWAAATRLVGENGLGMSIEAVVQEMLVIKQLF